MRPVVLVAYRACPAAFVHGRDLMSILALVLFLQVNCHLSVIRMTDDIDCLLFVSFLILSKNLVRRFPGEAALPEWGSRTPAAFRRRPPSV